MTERFQYCPKCGGDLQRKQVGGHLRLVCRKCRYVFYENPIVGVAVILVEEHRILLGKRSKRSTYPGLWCIPCGYVEYGEDVRDAARREMKEETGLDVELGPVFNVLSNFHNPTNLTVGIWFLSRRTGGQLAPDDDIDEVRWFALDDPPPMAFPTDLEVLLQLAENVA